ncbi:MAG: FtsQ-type POTRA domain-containing protein [Patescibacteria group bacterium]
MNEVLNLFFGIFLISQISCKTQFGACDQNEYKRLDQFKGNNLVTLSNKKVEESLLQDFKNEKVYVHKILPNTLSVIIKKRTGFIGISKEDLDGTFLVAKDGTVLSFEKSSAVPTLVLSPTFPNPVVGEKVSNKVLTSGKILQLVSKVQTVKNTTLEEEKLSLDLGDTKILFPTNRDPEVLVGALQLILLDAKIERLRMNNKVPVSIDLRFKNPVLKYK